MLSFSGCMQTRSKGLPLEPIDLEIEASNRRRNALKRLNQRIRVSSPVQRRSPSPVQEPPSPTLSPVHSPVQFEPHPPFLMDGGNGGNNRNNNPPPPLTNAQLQEQLAALQRRLGRMGYQRRICLPIMECPIQQSLATTWMLTTLSSGGGSFRW